MPHCSSFSPVNLEPTNQEQLTVGQQNKDSDKKYVFDIFYQLLRSYLQHGNFILMSYLFDCRYFLDIFAALVWLRYKSMF